MTDKIKFSTLLHGEEGYLNLKSINSQIVHIENSLSSFDGPPHTLCGLIVKDFGKWKTHFKFEEERDITDSKRCKKCEKRYLNRIK